MGKEALESLNLCQDTPTRLLQEQHTLITGKACWGVGLQIHIYLESKADRESPCTELQRLTWVQVCERAHHKVQCGHGQQEQQQQLEADDPFDTC